MKYKIFMGILLFALLVGCDECDEYKYTQEEIKNMKFEGSHDDFMNEFSCDTIIRYSEDGSLSTNTMWFMPVRCYQAYNECAEELNCKWTEYAEAVGSCKCGDCYISDDQPMNRFYWRGTCECNMINETKTVKKI